MKRKKKTEIVVERDQVLVIRGLETLAPTWCPGCAGDIRMLRVDEAAAMAGISSRTVYRQVEAGKLHFIETADGVLLVCLNSLIREQMSPIEEQRDMVVLTQTNQSKLHKIRTLLQFLTCSSLILCLFNSAVAQNNTLVDPQKSALTITAFATSERVRFTAPSTVVQIRLEVYNSAGKKMFDEEVRGGNVLDWHLQDGQAEPLADDSYLCVITVKSLSGKLTQRIGSVTVEKNSAAVQSVEASQITAQQSQAIGPVEDNASLIVLKEDDNQTTVVIAHNGDEGQIIRGQGALSFRLGDFYKGRDIEQMRLTPEGNLGIGITHPLVRLDVDGLVRASQGIVFPDGSVQYSAATKTYGAKSSLPDPSFQSLGSKSGKNSPGGQEHIDAAGTGTQNFIAKWAETGLSGTLQDSGIFETAGGNVGIGTTSPFTKLDVGGGVNIGGSNLYLGGSLRFTDNAGAGYTNFVALKGNLTNFDGVNYEQLNLYNPGGDKAIHLAQTAAGSQIASIGAGNTTLSLQPSGGNVGIGTITPEARLHLSTFTGSFEPYAGLSIDRSYSQVASPDGYAFRIRTIDLSQLTGARTDFLVDPFGSVGIGTSTPQARLDVNGSARVTGLLNAGQLNIAIGAQVGGSLTATTASSSYGLIHTDGGVQMGTFVGAGQVNPAGGWLGTRSNHPLYFFTNNGAASMAIDTSGNLSQPRGNNGLPKAMVYLNQDGTIGRCYNGITGSSGGGCGFTSTHQALGSYLIDFGFQITDRFIVATSTQSGGSTAASPGFFSDNVLGVSIRYITNSADVGAYTNAPFFVIVF